jgi:hypothetical protein
VAVDASGNVYVADAGNHRIQKFSSAGILLTKWGSYGAEDGQLNSPRSVGVGATGNVYVADTFNSRIQEFSLPGQTDPGTGSEGGGGGGGGKCFIATAAYGSYLDPHVQALREFRDGFLARYSTGRRFIGLYYEYSPPIAQFIEKSEAPKFAVRGILTPVVYAIEYPYATAVILIAPIFAVFIGRRRNSRVP